MPAETLGKKKAEVCGSVGGLLSGTSYCSALTSPNLMVVFIVEAAVAVLYSRSTAPC
jgi:hypothetical protein